MTENVDFSCYSFMKSCSTGFDEAGAVTYFGNKIKYKKLFKDIDLLTQYFLSIGLKHGDVFTIFLPTTVQSIVAFYALNKIGVISNIVYPLTPPVVLIEKMERLNSKGILILDLLAAPYIKLLKERNYKIIVCSNSDYVGWLTPFFKIFEHLKVKSANEILQSTTKYCDALRVHEKFDNSYTPSGSDIAVFLHGGGTTGESKTIMLSNSALNYLALTVSRLDKEHKPGDEYSLVVLPLFHAFGLGVSVHFSLCNGFCCVPVPKFKPSSVNKLINRYNITFIVGVPNMYKKMLEESNFEGKHLKKLRLLFSGGDVLSEQLITQFNEKIRKFGGSGTLMRGYGLTEASSVCCTNTEKNLRENSIGKPLEGIKMSIWDESENELPFGEIGEIVVTGPTLMLGYHNADAEFGHGLTEKDGEKWVKTGDLGYRDEDGYFYFTSRKKRMIIISGYNVYPNDIENRVLTLPFIKEACAVEDSQNGKTIIKLCVSLQDSSMSENQAVKLIDDFCKENLQRYCQPRKITVMDELPKTNMGKIDFVQLGKK